MTEINTDAVRMAMVPQMPAELAAAVVAGEPTWDTAELQRDFRVLGFAAPFVVVERKSDGVKGSLKFVGSPRFYFSFQAD